MASKRKSLFLSRHAAAIQKRIAIAVEKIQKNKVVRKLVRTKYYIALY